jgi:hypothetical protein
MPGLPQLYYEICGLAKELSLAVLEEG